MGYVEETDVRTMLQDQSRVDEIIPAAVEDSEAMSELAEDVADELEDLLEDDGASGLDLWMTVLAWCSFLILTDAVVGKLINN